jgi:hypothetical protein
MQIARATGVGGETEGKFPRTPDVGNVLGVFVVRQIVVAFIIIPIRRLTWCERGTGGINRR